MLHYNNKPSNSSGKNSIVVPLPKKEIPHDASDMRPLSLLPLPGKIMERIIARRLMSYLENNSILSDCQYGFRPKRSTMTSMSALLNDIYININNYKPTYTIFLDSKKAFDTVSHPILITKLEELGLSTACTVWLSSYLSGRIQKVILNGQVSPGKPISYGVPQRSVLGPILFSIYINNLPKICGTGIQMYADDTVLYSTDPIKLQESLDATLKWCGHIVLTINTLKTKWMMIGVTNRTWNQNVKFIANNNQLEYVKYFAVHFDPLLNYSIHRQKLMNHVQMKLNYFAQIRCFLNNEAALLIYKTTILPLIEYADYIIDQNNQLQNLQNRGLRIALNQHIKRYDERMTTEEMHRAARIYQNCVIVENYICYNMHLI